MITITEDDITQWASHHRDAESLLPELVRRAILGTVPFSEICEIGFPGSKGVGAGGFDGVLCTAKGTLYSATEESRWELSVRGDIAGKANSDYRKRKPHADTSFTYVTVTARLWSGKDAWRNTKKSDGAWADVRTYDATDLAQWLSSAPAACIWFRAISGRPVSGLMSADPFLRNWCHRCDPPLPKAVATAGRGSQVEKLRRWLDGTPGMLRLWGETREECVVFLLAVLAEATDEETGWAARTAIVCEQSRWRELVEASAGLGEPQLLVPDFLEFDGSAYVAGRHFVVAPHEPGCIRKGMDIELLPIDRDSLAEALAPCVRCSDTAKRLARESGGKLTALQRLLGYVRVRPSWVAAADPTIRNALLLAGAWDPANEGDRNTITDLCGGVGWPTVEAAVHHLRTCPDAPLRSYGRGVRFRSPRDAWLLLSEELTESGLHHFQEACTRALGEADPAYGLPSEERPYARVRGMDYSISGLLREGLCEGLAWLAVHAEIIERVVPTVNIAVLVAGVLRQVLAGGWQVWASLGSELQCLAEAAPDEFLDIVEEALSETESKLRALLEQDQEDGLFAGCCHAGLLWALETLAWNPDHFPRVVTALTRLALVDPGGRHCNRPFASLESLFDPACKMSAIKMDDRLKVLGSLFVQQEDVGWRLLLGLNEKACPGGWTIDQNSRPRFRDWEIPGGFEHHSPEDRGRFWKSIVGMTEGLVAGVPRRLADVVQRGAFGVFSAYRFRELIEEHLERFRDEGDEFLAGFQNRLREVLRYLGEDTPPEARSAVEVALGLLHPDGQSFRTAWLFDHDPKVPGAGLDRDWHEEEAEVKKLRVEAVRQILDKGGALHQILELAHHCQQPSLVGETLAELSDADGLAPEIDALVVGEDHCTKELASGFWWCRVGKRGMGWLVEELTRLLPCHGMQWTLELVRSFRSTPEIRDWVGEQRAELASAYWQTTGFHVVRFRNDADFARTVDRLLECHRWDAALEVSRWAIHGKLGTAQDFMRVLCHGLVAEPAEAGRAVAGPIVRNVPDIFRRLDEWPEADENELARLEVFYLRVLEHSRRPPQFVYTELARSPELFADLVRLQFRSHSRNADDDSESAEGEERDRAKSAAQTAFHLLHAWQGYPASDRPPVERDACLARWCDEAYRLCRESDREKTGAQKIGEVLSRVPACEDDGIWPCKVAREYLRAGQKEIATGVELGRINSRGVTSRMPDAGGELERKLAAKYREDASKVKYTWPSTARFLERLAEHYEYHAKREDSDADQWRDP